MTRRRGTATGDAPGADPPEQKPRAGARVVEVAADPADPVTLTSLAKMRVRIDEAETLLATCVDPKRARHRLAQTWGMDAKQAGKYVKAVHSLWRLRSKADPEATRAAMRGQLESVLRHVVEVGLERKRGMVDTSGTEHEFADPDLRSVLGAVDTLARFHGITEPVTIDARSVHLHGTSDPDTLRRIRAAYFSSAVDEPAALPATIDVVDE